MYEVKNFHKDFTHATIALNDIMTHAKEQIKGRLSRDHTHITPEKPEVLSRRDI